MAGRIRNFSLLNVLPCWWGIFVFSACFFPIRDWNEEDGAALAAPAPDQRQKSYLALVGVTKKKNPWIGGFYFRHCTVMSDLSCFCVGRLMLPHGTVLGGCVRWGALLRGQQCWFRSMLNAISPGISCASFQPQSVCSHGEAAKCQLYECDRDI